ncbi:MAG: hypothetical protein JEZ04_20820 [Spirochaetales bacterium]|nr:hypothetical protein [Spirochaetales bacterium]
MYTARSAEAVSKNNNPLNFNPFRTGGIDEDPSVTIVSDAFEAVTNGMHNPEAMIRLEKLEKAESFDQWKLLIRAVDAFYSQDFQTLEDCLEKIPSDSLAGSLKPVLYHMSGQKQLNRKPTFNEEKLIKRVTEDSRFLVSAAAQLTESIEYSGDLFIETASLLIKEIKVNNPEASERLALWCFSVCFEYSFDEEPLADNVLMLYGQAEGLRLIALSLMEEDPESSLICFTRALIKRLIDKSIEKDEAGAWLDIIDTLMTACPPSNPILVDMSELLSMLGTELSLYFSIGNGMELSSSPHEKLKNMKRSIGFMKQPLKPGAIGNTAIGNTAIGNTAIGNTAIGNTAIGKTSRQKTASTAAPENKSREAVQLELF